MNRSKYWGIVVFSLFLLFSCWVTRPAGAVTSFRDLENHWAEKEIIAWENKGLVAGYADGTFRPDQRITRAEFITLVNRAFGYQEKTMFAFTDVAENDWFVTEIAKAQVIGYLAGYPDGTVRPQHSLSRQEVAAIVTKVLPSRVTQFNLRAQFTDSAAIPAWSLSAVKAVVEQGYMRGYPDNTFRAAQAVTRAEAIVVLARVVGILYHQAGSYDLPETIQGNVTLSTRDITLKNVIINGDLYLTEGIGRGNIVLENVQVKGTTRIKGGGENSVIIINSALGPVLIQAPANQKIRFVAQGSTSIGQVEVKSATKLVEQDLTGAGFGDLVVVLPPGATIELQGHFGQIEVETPQTKIELQEGTIEKITLAPATQGTSINLAPATTLNALLAYSAATVTGEGTIETANINADGVELATAPTKKLEIAAGVQAFVEGKTQEGQTPSVPPGTSGGGSGGSSIVDVDVGIDFFAAYCNTPDEIDGDFQGYVVGFSVTGIAIEQVDKVTVTLYQADGKVALVSNESTGKKLRQYYGDGQTIFWSPFRVRGTYDRTANPWEMGGNLGENVIPERAVLQIEISGKTFDAESTVLLNRTAEVLLTFQTTATAG